MSGDFSLGSVPLDFTGLEVEAPGEETETPEKAAAAKASSEQPAFGLAPLARVGPLDFGGGGDEEEEEDDDDDEDDDEDDEDEEEEETQPSDKRAKPSNPFLDIEAEDDDDEDEDDGEQEEGFTDLVVDDAVPQERSSAKEYRSFWAETEKEAFQGDEAMEEAIRARYADVRYDREVEQEVGDEVVPDMGLLPGITDPKLFMVKCKPGKENEAVIAIMTRYFTKRDAGQSLPMMSVTALQHTKGFIFVEAMRELDVRSSIHGVRHVFSWKTQMVPLKQMPDVLRASNTSKMLAEGDWVRPARRDDPNHGDLGRVYSVSRNGARAEVMLIPRINLDPEREIQEEEEEEEAAAEGAEGDKPKPKKRKRGPPKMAKTHRAQLFNEELVRQKYGIDAVKERSEGGRMWYFFDNKKFGIEDGYLYKTINLRSLKTTGVDPTLEELQQFTEGMKKGDTIGKTAEEKLVMLSKLANIRSKPVQFLKGDRVKVISGSEKGLLGDVVSVAPDLISVQLASLNMRENFKPTELQKHFEAGDHVKVVAGTHKGETGMVSSLMDNLVYMVRDADFSQLKVLRQDIQKTTEVASGRTHLGQFRLHDLVRLGQRNVGVIVKIGTSSFQVLDQTNKLHTVDQAALQAKVQGSKVSFDAKQEEVEPSDLLRVQEGRYKNISGEVKHLYRWYAWIQSRNHYENGGMLAVKTSECVKGASAGGPNSMRNRMVPRLAGGAMPLQSPSRHGGHKPITQMGSSRFGRSKRNDEFMHKQVKIIRGKYKSRVATVQDVLDNKLRVMLQANQRVVTVMRTDVKLEDESQAPRQGRAEDRGWIDRPQTPSYFAQTPSRHTPQHGEDDEVWNADADLFDEVDDQAGGWSTLDMDEASSSQQPLSYSASATPAWSAGGSYSRLQGSGGMMGQPLAQSSMAPTPNEGMGASAMYASQRYQPQPQAPIFTAPQHDGQWQQRSLEVEVTQGDFAGQTGGILSVEGNSCLIQLAGGGEERIPASYLRPAIPVADDQIIMIAGDGVGKRGKITSIEANGDALVEFVDYSFDVLPVKNLGKIFGPMIQNVK